MFTTTSTTLALAATLFGSSAIAAATYKQISDYKYPSFFDGFDYFNGDDPTGGFIFYQDRVAAKEQALTGWVYYEGSKDNNAWIGVDSKGDASSGRNSIRLISKEKYQVGTLTVIDVRHIPTGPALWPAVWYLAPPEDAEWPYGGEMDIMEWVNNNTENHMTLHTGPGCVVDQTPSKYAGELINEDCSYGENGILGSNGCSIPAPEKYAPNGRTLATAGPEFNKQGGGIYVHEWTSDSISVWLFPHDAIPADLKAGNPNPSSWKQKPLARFSGAGCDFTTAFKPQQLIINIDVCGTWAGNAYPGGVEACNAFAAENSKAFEDAFFEFASIKMYSSNSGADPRPSKREAHGGEHSGDAATATYTVESTSTTTLTTTRTMTLAPEVYSLQVSYDNSRHSYPTGTVGAMNGTAPGNGSRNSTRFGGQNNFHASGRLPHRPSATPSIPTSGASGAADIGRWLSGAVVLVVIAALLCLPGVAMLALFEWRHNGRYMKKN
ncbi:hypothetical protein LTR37_018920 [Vermiconidia calcicola]|uniref:Uncharacterized protein n=1 Tax=Vermiconidia calcicola TaxID=1690605 RepID=A0ACC3MFQ0_9PEZI|nr:hypothetical protein LTR37_018920 [Vermiconidia calcicola]